MSDSRLLSVATVNTLFGRAIVRDGGLEAVVGADVLLLQEVFSPTGYGLEPRLNSLGFELVAAGGHFGLALAVKSNSGIARTSEPVRSTVLEQVGSVERALTARFAKQPLEYSDFGVLAAHFETPEGRRLTIATTHLPVMTSFRQRRRFLAHLPRELADPYYEGLLVLGGDMNHYPGPRKTDLAFRRLSRLAAVDLGNEITWPSKKAPGADSRLRRLFGGQLDDILYRGSGIEFVHKRVADVASDHRSIVATFAINADLQ